MIHNNPTRGIDVRTKQEAYRLISRWAEEGFKILFISSEIEEVLGVIHCVMVMNNGNLIKEFKTQQTNKEGVMRYVLSGNASQA